MSSPVCPHPASQMTLLFSARDYISGDDFQIRQCGACGGVRTYPVPQDASQYYPAGYYGAEQRYHWILEYGLRRLYAYRAASIERASGVRGGRALDIGCGQGHLLRALRDRGWTVLGTELTDQSARHARDVLGLEVRTDDGAPRDLPSDHFDVVIIWHVLEHMPRPEDLLAEVARVLSPTGTVLVGVPNFGSLEARWGRSAWFHLDVPRHLAHFTPAELRTLLGGVGLTPYKESYLAPEYDLFSVVQTALNRVGIRHNLLYNLLRSRGAKMFGAQTATIPLRDVVATMWLTPSLGIAALLWVAITSVLNQGAALTMYARKADYL